MQVVELWEALLQVRGKVYSPSCLKNPDGVSGFEIVGLQESLPLRGKIVCPEHPCGLVVAGNDAVAVAGELFELGRGKVEGNGTLLAEIVTQHEIGLVIDEDEFGRLHVVAYEIESSDHVSAGLIGALHAGLPALAKGDASREDESCDGESTIPIFSRRTHRQTCYCHADASDSGDEIGRA